VAVAVERNHVPCSSTGNGCSGAVVVVDSGPVPAAPSDEGDPPLHAESTAEASTATAKVRIRTDLA
jgi:hypothetical protein